MHLIVGTAGHIDHGKTALVKALTGVDADRLPEEKQRGITIDLGFAEADLGGVRIGFVDVPGHERFVKNMLAGASGIDIVLLVIAADEGIMPQTREHFDICRLLQIKNGIVVLTKSDLADDEMLDLVKLDVAELIENSFLSNAKIIPVSAKTGDGIDVLKRELVELAPQIPVRQNRTVARLPIDRSFTMKGFGAVVTGTLASGDINESVELDLLPLGKRVRVRGVQSHGQSVKTASAAQRTAVNLAGVEHSDIERGMVLTEPGTLRPTQIFDAEVEVLATAPRPLRSRQRVRVHLGTSEVLARISVMNESREIEPGKKGLVQLRLETSAVGIFGDRFIVRRYSPQTTIAGGEILLAHAPKHRTRDIEAINFFLKKLIDSSSNIPEQIRLIVNNAAESGVTLSDLQAQTGFRKDILRAAIEESKKGGRVVEAEDHFLSDHALNDLTTKLVDEVGRHHKLEPLTRGMPKEVLRDRVFKRRPAVFRYVVAELERSGVIKQDRDVIRLTSHRSQLSPVEDRAIEKLRGIYSLAGMEVPKLDEALVQASAVSSLDRNATRKIFQLLLDAGEIVQISDEFFFETSLIDNLVTDIRRYADSTADRVIDVPKFKEIAGISRKYAIPLLEYFDLQKITQRVGEKRIVMK
jgi:selenocysteine-specific elongation factor